MQSRPDNHSIIIEASAGSGKTYQLVNRLIQLLINGASPSHIVAITFTRKASAEMQNRLQERLYDLAVANTPDTKQLLKNAGVEDSSQNIAKAKILYEQILLSPQTVRCMTFHSFCQEILKRFPFEADVPPGFELTEQTFIYQQQAWHALMADCEAQPDSQPAKAIAFLFNELGLHNTRESLKSFLQQRGDWWAWTKNANNPVGLAISKMQALLNADPEADPLNDFIKQSSLETSLKHFCSSLEKLKAATYKTWLAAIGEARNTELNKEVRYQLLKKAFLTASNTPRVIKIAKALQPLFAGTEEDDFLELRNKICQQILAVEDQLKLQKSFQINKHWYIAGEKYLELYQAIKTELRLLDFTDLEWKTYCLLTKSQHAHWIQYKLDARINHFLIDEFQDTNPIQWHLLQPLIDEFRESNATDEDRSVLLVGDTKQSIYRFRRAEPKLFPMAGNYIKDNFECDRMQLIASWRSSPAIINFVNKVFSTEPLNNIIADFPSHKTQLDNLPGEVCVINYPQSPETENVAVGDSFRNPLLTPKTEKIGEHQLEAEIIANKIKQLINNKTRIFEDDKSRDIKYKDIIILLRNRVNAASYEQALHRLNIPYVGSERGTLLNCLEVNDIVMLLNWLITPFNNIALVSILRSPIFSVSDQTLMQLAQINSVDNGSSNWFYRIETLLQTQHKDPVLQHALELLNRWRSVAIQIPVHDLLDMIYNEADVLAQYRRACPEHLQLRVQANLTRIVELALEVDSGRYPSLQQFISHIEHLRQQSEDAPDIPSASNDTNRVQVMTIHASKGLEAPVIFLANADAETASKYSYKTIIDWPARKEKPDMMLLANNADNRDSVTDTLIDKDMSAQQRETANLFYVAITRARQYLFISAAKPTPNNTDWYSVIRQCYELDNSDEAEQIIETHTINSASTDKHTDDISPEYLKHHDTRLNTKLNITPDYQDITTSLSPSKLVDDNKPASDIKTDTDATQRGIIIHAILEQLCKNPGYSEDKLKNIIGVDVPERLWASCWEEAHSVFSCNAFSFIFTTNHPAYSEAPVSQLQDSIMMYGIIDRIIVEDNTVHIIDYKTHQHVDNSNIEHYATHYKPQLDYYQQAAKNLWPGHHIKSYLLFTHNKLLHTYK